MQKIVVAVSLSLLLFDSLGCSGSTATGPEDAAISDDGSKQNDAQPPPPSDAGQDATVSDAGGDATRSDSGGDLDAASDVQATDGSTEAGLDCAALLAKMLSAPVAPPNGWLGLDLSNGAAVDGGFGSGGLTIDQADILACATSVEPNVLEAGVAPINPGARTAIFGGDAGSVSVSYNLDSRVIWLVDVTAPATATLTFHARVGGSYDEGSPDGGPTVYVVGLGPGGEDGGAGFVTKNGVDFPANWNLTADDAGSSQPSDWANEIYDGLMATYAPSVPSVPDCLNAPMLRPVTAERASACFVINTPAGAYFGVRPLGFYLTFAAGTNHTQSMYELWPGGWPSCATPGAAVENLDYGSILPTWNENPAIGPIWGGTSIGTMSPAEPLSNGAGLLASEANTIAGCGAVSVSAPDPGYVAEEWGVNGEVELEYNPDSGVAYKLFAKKGFQGTVNSFAPEEDGGTNTYVIGPGTLTENGAPVTLAWADGDAGTLNSAVTDISNGWLGNYYCGIVDTDCVQAGDCLIQPNDGHGHSTFTLVSGPAVVAACGIDVHPLTFVFQQGSSVPTEIYATNPGGQ